MSMYARQQPTLAELTQSVPGSTDLSTIMQQAVTVVADTLAVAHSTIWQLQPDGSALALGFSVGWQEDAMQGMMVEATETSPIGYTVLSS
jgi:GAF domain-containing protein